jgi:predicted Zn-ribbon and HTH transcriptional regulator
VSLWLLGTSNCRQPIVIRAAQALVAVLGGHATASDHAELDWLLASGLGWREGRNVRHLPESHGVTVAHGEWADQEIPVVFERLVERAGADSGRWIEQPAHRVCACGFVFRPKVKSSAKRCPDCHAGRSRRDPGRRECSACGEEFIAADPRRRLCTACRKPAARMRRSRESDGFSTTRSTTSAPSSPTPPTRKPRRSGAFS